MAEIKIGNVTDNTIQVKITGFDTGYTYNNRQIIWYLNGEQYGNPVTLKAGSASSSKTFRNLEPGTYYEIEAYIEFTEPPSMYIPPFCIDTYTNQAFPTFSWTYANANASGKPQRSSDGYKHDGYFYVSASEWNELIDAVKPRIEKHYPGMYPMNKVSPGDEFTAGLFNEVRLAIGVMHSTGIQNKRQNDVITVSDLNKLMDCVNAITA